MKDNDWKDRLGVMYSTNPDFQYNTGDTEEEDTLPKEKQALRISLDKPYDLIPDRYANNL